MALKSLYLLFELSTNLLWWNYSNTLANFPKAANNNFTNKILDL